MARISCLAEENYKNEYDILVYQIKYALSVIFRYSSILSIDRCVIIKYKLTYAIT
jgi:hypothetical protein